MATECHKCYRVFNHWNPAVNQHSLRQHMQVHEPRKVSCPLCGVTKFRNSANAVQHIEAGACTACRGHDNARSQIYRFVSRNEASRQFLKPRAQLQFHAAATRTPRMTACPRVLTRAGCATGTSDTCPASCSTCLTSTKLMVVQEL